MFHSNHQLQAGKLLPDDSINITFKPTNDLVRQVGMMQLYTQAPTDQGSGSRSHTRPEVSQSPSSKPREPGHPKVANLHTHKHTGRQPLQAEPELRPREVSHKEA